jgi:hypothetical protein
VGTTVTFVVGTLVVGTAPLLALPFALTLADITWLAIGKRKSWHAA